MFFYHPATPPAPPRLSQRDGHVAPVYRVIAIINRPKSHVPDTKISAPVVFDDWKATSVGENLTPFRLVRSPRRDHAQTESLTATLVKSRLEGF